MEYELDRFGEAVLSRQPNGASIVQDPGTSTAHAYLASGRWRRRSIIQLVLYVHEDQGNRPADEFVYAKMRRNSKAMRLQCVQRMRMGLDPISSLSCILPVLFNLL